MSTDTEAIAARLTEMVEGDETRAAKTHGTYQSDTSSFYYHPGASSAGPVVNERTSLSISAVFACVRNIGEDAAKLPFQVYRKLGRGKERYPAHPLYRLLHDDPNPETSAFDFRQAITACAVLWGNGYAEIERSNDGTPINLWQIEPWRVCLHRDTSGTLYYLVDGTTRLEMADVIHIKGFGTSGVLGCMIAQVGRDAFGLAIAAQQFAAGFFGNGLQLSGFLKHPKSLSDPARNNLRNSISKRHVGQGNQNGFMILEEGLEWVSASTPPEAAQMLETRQFQVEDVARWFRMPPHKIQHLANATFSNIEHQGIEYVTDTLMPWLVRWEQETKRKMIDKSEPDVFPEHLVDALLRGDITSRYAAYAVARQNGWFNANDILELENRNPLPGDEGEAYLVNGNMIPISAAMQAGPSNAATQPAPAGNADLVDDPSDAIRSAVECSHRPALMDAALRVVRRETEVIRRKAKRPDGLADAVREFYTQHNDYARASLRSAVGAYVGVATAMRFTTADTESLVSRVVVEHLRAAEAEFVCVAEDPAQIEAILSTWETRRAGLIVSSIMNAVASKQD